MRFEQASPEVAEKLIRIFRALPDDSPEMVLAFAREILDRGLGRPKQVLDVKESREYIEYKHIQELILADNEAIGLAAALIDSCSSGQADATALKVASALLGGESLGQAYAEVWKMAIATAAGSSEVLADAAIMAMARAAIEAQASVAATAADKRVILSIVSKITRMRAMRSNMR